MVERKERRRYPRIKDKDIGIKLSGEGFGTITQSLDVSASGIYCKVKDRIPIMTKVQIVLSLPGRGKSSSNLDIEGVVVREHPVVKDGKVQHYDVAIFFASLMPKERAQLARYIEKRTKYLAKQ